MKYRILESDSGKYKVQYRCLLMWYDSRTEDTLEEAKSYIKRAKKIDEEVKPKWKVVYSE